MSIKRKQKLAIDLYKEAIEYTPFELNEELSGELNALLDYVETKNFSKDESELNSFIYLINAIETCLPYFKTQLNCMNTNNKKYTMGEVEDKLINDYLNNQTESVAELNINDWCVKNGIFNIEDEKTDENKN